LGLHSRGRGRIGTRGTAGRTVASHLLSLDDDERGDPAEQHEWDVIATTHCESGEGRGRARQPELAASIAQRTGGQ